MLSKKIKSTLGREIGVAHMLMQQALDAELQKVSDLNSDQLILMMIIHCDQTMGKTQMIKDIGLANQDLDDLLAPLLKNKIIHFDAEQKLYSITLQGEEIIGKLWSVVEICEQKILHDFTSEEKAKLNTFLKRIQANCAVISS